MTLGTFNHLALTVRDRAQSKPFYETILGFMGYQQVEETEWFTMWWAEAAGAILIYTADPNSPNKLHDRYSPGFHHLAFNADSRDQVNRLHELLLEIEATILDSPAEYNHYAPGYYAVFFTDPDGLKLELVHMPSLPD